MITRWLFKMTYQHLIVNTINVIGEDYYSVRWPIEIIEYNVSKFVLVLIGMNHNIFSNIENTTINDN